MNNKKLFLAVLTAFLALAAPAQAICPICIVGVGAGLELSQWLGIDDTITFLWLGALIVSLIGWTVNWLHRKNWKFFADGLIITVAYILMAMGPAYWQLQKNQSWGHPAHAVMGLDKLWVGTVLGAVLFLLAHFFSNWLKKKNNGKAYFPFQKVIIPLVLLIIASVLVYLSNQNILLPKFF